MSATTNIVLNDGTSDQTFNPLRRINGRLQFLNKVGGMPAAYKGISLLHDLWSAKRATTKVEANLDFPLERVDAVSGIHTAVDVARFRGSYTLPKTMTAAERTQFFKLVKALSGSLTVEGYVVNDDPML